MCVYDGFFFFPFSQLVYGLHIHGIYKPHYSEDAIIQFINVIRLSFVASLACSGQHILNEHFLLDRAITVYAKSIYIQ